MPTSNLFRTERHVELTRIVKESGGKLVPKTYSNLRVLLAIDCKNGHRFKMTGKNLMRGMWCAKCRPLSRQAEFLEYAKTAARKLGGKCLATSYETARIKLPWSCKEGHRWEASFDNVVNKESWCPTCAAATISDRKKKWWRAQSQSRLKKRRKR